MQHKETKRVQDLIVCALKGGQREVSCGIAGRADVLSVRENIIVEIKPPNLTFIRNAISQLNFYALHSGLTSPKLCIVPTSPVPESLKFRYLKEFAELYGVDVYRKVGDFVEDILEARRNRDSDSETESDDEEEMGGGSSHVPVAEFNSFLRKTAASIAEMKREQQLFEHKKLSRRFGRGSQRSEVRKSMLRVALCFHEEPSVDDLLEAFKDQDIIRNNLTYEIDEYEGDLSRQEAALNLMKGLKCAGFKDNEYVVVGALTGTAKELLKKSYTHHTDDKVKNKKRRRQALERKRQGRRNFLLLSKHASSMAHICRAVENFGLRCVSKRKERLSKGVRTRWRVYKIAADPRIERLKQLLDTDALLM